MAINFTNGQKTGVLLMERKGRSRPPQGNAHVAYVRVGPLAALPGLTLELGADPELLARETGLDPTLLADPDVEIPYLAASGFIARCVEATGCQHLGLLLAQRSPASSLGLPGFMLRNAPDVGTALRTLLRNLSLHDQGGEVTLHLRGDSVSLGYVIHEPAAEAADQIYDLCLGISCNIMREICGAHWQPEQVLLPRKPPPDTRLHKAFFRAPMSFNATEAAVVFGSRCLDSGIAGADPLLYRHLEREAAEQHHSRRRDLVDQLRWTLRRLLVERRCSGAQAAKELRLHPRTLDRRLRAERTSYRAELERVRFDMARQFLSDTDMSIAKIATTLDYADTTTFARAFKRWSGATPSAWRSRSER